jgi:hypothetical protein
MMSELKFTPGPWVVDESRHEGSVNRLEPFRHIGMVSGFQYDAGSRAENEANAKLIAAAPDLYVALTEARQVIATALAVGAPDWFDSAAKIAQHATVKKIDAAIQKATA